MSSDSTSKPNEDPLPVNVTPRGLEALQTYAKEIATYRRELPRLLVEKQEGRFVLIKGEQLVGIWDSWAEAIHAGRLQFGIKPIFVSKIDAQDHDKYALLDAWFASCQP